MNDFRTRLERELVAAAGRPRRLRYARSALPLRRQRPAVAPLVAMLIVLAVAVTVALRPVDRAGAPDRRSEVTERLKAYDPLTAQVLGRSPNPWYQQLLIDKGSADGVRSGDAVIDSSGLLGHVAEVRRNQAVVALLTDTGSITYGVTGTSTQAGRVIADLRAPGSLLLTSVEDVARVRAGELVMTEAPPPAGIPIGRVESIVADRIFVAPAADLAAARSVQVLRARRTAMSTAVPVTPFSGQGPSSDRPRRR